jgi:hypothetical protein
MQINQIWAEQSACLVISFSGGSIGGARNKRPGICQRPSFVVLARFLLRHEAHVPDGGEGPSVAPRSQRWGESWRQPEPGVAGESGSSLAKVAPVQDCRMGRAR